MIRIDFDPVEYLKSGTLLFVPDDLKDAANLAAKLEAAIDPLSQYVYAQFSPETQQQMKDFDASAAALDALKNSLVEELNKILKGAGVFDKKRFAGVTLGRETLIKGLTKPKPQAALKDDSLISCNRLLLEEAYSEDLLQNARAEWNGWVSLAEVATSDVIDQWEKWKKLRQDWMENLEEGEKGKAFEGFKAKLDDDIWKGFRNWLLEHVFRNKCAYCETPFVGFIGDAEHFRPKCEVSQLREDGSSQKVTVVDEDNNEIAHPGYFWLAYNWQNLLPSCHLCNRYGGKKTLFPVTISHVAVRRLTITEIDHLISKEKRSTLAEDIFYLQPKDLDAQEGRLLLHPYYDEPQDHIYFEVGGKAAEWRGSKQGAVSIRVYDLNNSSKVKARDQGQREGLRSYFSKLSGTKVDLNEWKKAIQELKDEYYQGERSYAVAVFDYVHQQLEGTDIDPDRLLGERRKTT